MGALGSGGEMVWEGMGAAFLMLLVHICVSRHMHAPDRQHAHTAAVVVRWCGKEWAPSGGDSQARAPAVSASQQLTYSSSSIGRAAAATHRQQRHNSASGGGIPGVPGGPRQRLEGASNHSTG